MTYRLDRERQTEFDTLLQEFLQSYVATPLGQEHRQAYAVLRASAQRAYTSLEGRAARDEEITDAVLWTLLPYTDSAQHRAQGAWVHLAPAITGDLRAWHEAAGWAQPDSWPRVAQAIWRFVRQCIQNPAGLEGYCSEFVARPDTKGFQTGMLSPILNALRPDDFALIHTKLRTVLGYFTGVSFSPSLAEYPAANAFLQALIQHQPGLNQAAAQLNMRPGDLFDMFSHWLVAIRRFVFRPVRYWRMVVEDEPGLWAEWREGQIVALGWDELGDVAGLQRAEFDRRRDSLIAQFPNRTKAGAQTVWRFARHLREGDRVVVADRSGLVLGIGAIAGDYYYVPELDLGHRRPVLWDDLTPRQGLPGPSQALAEIDRATLEAAAQAPMLAVPPVTAPPALPARIAERGDGYAVAPIQPAYDLAACAAETGLDSQLLARWVQAVERKGQAILYGPPGTGKTFVSLRLAKHLAAGGDGFIEVVQFHPAYTYEDFVQGIRPQVEAGGLVYAMVPGRFLDFCRKAAGRSGRCVLVIDEINRANLAQVFGELMYLLEYREASVLPAGDATPFAIPANVRILGTMNTADRSLALVDHALRRRFAFLALYPDFDLLRRYHDRHKTGFPVEPLIRLLARINAAIGDRNYALGITYFLHPDLATHLPEIWQTEIEPYLEEIFFDQPEQVEPFRRQIVIDGLQL